MTTTDETTPEVDWRLADPDHRALQRFANVGVNFMTPDVIGYFDTGRSAVEVSRGDFLGDDLFGVTVWRFSVEAWGDDRSQMFDSYTDAIEYVLAMTG